MYELNLLFSPILEKIDGETAAKIREFILSLGGVIKKENISEKRKLAYPIKKRGVGYYITFEFQIEPEKIEDLKKLLNFNHDILRFLIIDKSNVKEETARIRPIKPKAVAPFGRTEEAKGEKVKIEELDKKLEEILKE